MDTKKVEGIYIGSICNAKCGFCIDFGNSFGNTPKVESLENIQKQIDLLSKEGAIDCIIYEGGDFTVHSEIFEILTYGQSKGIKQTFQTNGLRLSDINFVRKLKEHKIDIINISLHATNEKLYDNIMGTKGGLIKVLKGIKNCNNLGITVSINFVIIKENINEITKILLLCIKLGIKQLSYYMYIPPISFSKEKHNEFLVHPLLVGEKIIKSLYILDKIEGKINGKIIDLKFLNIPLCLFENLSVEVNIDKFRKFRESDKKTDSQQYFFTKKCDKCLKKNLCPGITKYYVDYYGDEYIVPFNK